MDNVPLILWNNGTQLGCSTGGSCTNSIVLNVNDQDGDSSDVCTRPTSSYIKATAHTASVAKYNGAVDYCQGAAKPALCGTYANTYTPYTYPHPLQGGSSPADAGVPSRDAGTVTADSGVTVADAGTRPDAGLSASTDSGTSAVNDSGVVADAGLRAADAGLSDAGLSDPGPEGRCGCTIDLGSSGAWVLAVWAALSRRRKRSNGSKY